VPGPFYLHGLHFCLPDHLHGSDNDDDYSDLDDHGDQPQHSHHNPGGNDRDEYECHFDHKFPLPERLCTVRRQQP